MAITIQEAVTIAKKYLSEMLPEAGGDFLLEEIERSGQDWHVTLSFPRRQAGTLADAIMPSREYKVVDVNGQTGIPQSIKIRELAH